MEEPLKNNQENRQHEQLQVQGIDMYTREFHLSLPSIT